MARLLRLDIPGIPHHIVQRGNDRQPCFFTEHDYAYYLQNLRELSLQFDCHVHAYVLMTNHVHLLMTSGRSGAMSHVMQALGRRYVRHVNDCYHRTGTLWEGRYKSCPVDSECYLLRCYRYIELNPLRAGMVADPRDYPWSSHRFNAEGLQDSLVRPHPAYLALGVTSELRQRCYRALVAEAIDPDETTIIRSALQRQHALGNDRFREAIERQLNRRAGPARIGRPRKAQTGE